MKIDIDEIIQLLPHRYPFLLIDRVINFIPYKSVTAIKNVTINEPFFTGHFPTLPVMPGVLILEALAQASGIIILKSDEAEILKKDLFVFAGIDNARFKRMVRPGDQLQLHVELIKQKRDLYKFQANATVEGELVCSADIMNARRPKSDS